MIFMNICVFGAAKDDIAGIFFDETEKLGRAIAKRGHKLVFGGGMTGLMGAVARGAKAEKGKVYGIAPRFFDKPGVLLGDCDEFSFTDTMTERKQIMLDSSDAFVIVPGGLGTFDELFEILTLSGIEQNEKPIAILNTAGFYDKLLEFVDFAVAEGFIGKSVYGKFEVFAEPGELLDYVEKKPTRHQ